MEFIEIEGEDYPKVIYTPYIYSTVIECSKFYMVYSNTDPKVMVKKKKGEKL